MRKTYESPLFEVTVFTTTEDILNVSPGNDIGVDIGDLFIGDLWA